MRDISARVGGTNGAPEQEQQQSTEQTTSKSEPESVPAMLIEDIATPVENASEEEVAVSEAEPQSEMQSEPTTEKSGSMWAIILEAVLWGFAALLTPCVFPMVPMTVSFFIKGADSKRRGRFRALMYGLFIVLLYTVPIAIVILATRFIGGETVTSDIFNWLATHWLPNIVFFVVFMIFAASFFGAFEIVMPGSLVNKADKGSERGGLGGLFFMALTLVLVSFSCTGPIVGTVIVKATAGEFWEPIITMLAFSTAFALPFTLLALFPSLLKNLPKSGGWLNSVKVVLGFVEVALGFKFLSVADQTYHWGLLDREVYLAIWIVVFSMMGFYLLGKIRFAHDSEVKHVGVVRLSLAIAVFSFVVYMLPGMWGAPLKALSGYLPPISTQDFVVGGGASQSADPNVKYSDVLHLPHGLKGYFDYEQALEASAREDKPIFLDFTGHGCVNCREMEARVLADNEVQRLLREEYVVVALYGDDRMTLDKEDWLTTAGGTVLKTLGEKNSYIMSSTYGVNSQPAYLLLDSKGQQLVPMMSYELNVGRYVNFLKSGVEAYRNQR
jgi:thiol:disulfide interchange protein DsbD